MRFLGAVAALCAGWVVPVFAETEITEAAFVEGVTVEHPAVRALGEDVAAAEAAQRRAGLFANPSLQFDREHPEDNPRQDTWSVTWTPPLPGKYLLGRKAGNAAVRAEYDEAVASGKGPRHAGRWLLDAGAVVIGLGLLVLGARWLVAGRWRPPPSSESASWWSGSPSSRWAPRCPSWPRR